MLYAVWTASRRGEGTGCEGIQSEGRDRSTIITTGREVKDAPPGIQSSVWNQPCVDLMRLQEECDLGGIVDCTTKDSCWPSGSRRADLLFYGGGSRRGESTRGEMVQSEGRGMVESHYHGDKTERPIGRPNLV